MTRFRLLSKNSSVDAINAMSYNTWNKKEEIPGYFQEMNAKIFKDGQPDSDLELVKHLVSWLYAHTRVGPGLSEPSDIALKTMVYGKGGVCSDMVQIFNNFCVINDIQVREWGTTSAPFNRENGGHSFNEVYITELQKWLLIDPSWGMLFYDEQETPLSVVELYQRLRAGKKIQYRSFIKDKQIDAYQVDKNYLNADIIPFLICDYRNKTYDAYLKLARPHVPVFIIHFVVYVFGRSYHYKFPLDNYKKIFS
ncbi:transglutaminase domain-containing protein [Xanthomarina sp. F2636L]|uniref:transglutaminase domain-containing protein n=1 Tax=Xanthomarina sp. F2636L TaxID=2996018 RepID=UPI00225E056D|nr:transglutaminase domain-containing protein [Xanthomarina sp. F2636L]MCX7549383.1 hypothetical protein [Xanthomarina sp. F2636L]